MPTVATTSSVSLIITVKRKELAITNAIDRRSIRKERNNMDYSKDKKVMLSDLELKLDALLEEKESEIIETIYFDIIYDFHTSQKYEKHHDWDPPYDHSGTLFQSSKPYDVDDYSIVSDFLEEYTGDSEATFCSGFGLHYPNYGEHYRSMAEEILFGVTNEFITNLDTEIIKEMAVEANWIKEYEKAQSGTGGWEINDVAIELADYFEYYWKACFKAHKIIDEIGKSDFRYWYDKLTECVQKKIVEDNRIMQQKQKEEQTRINLEKQKLSAMWETLEKQRLLEYEEKMPKSVDAHQLPEFLEFLIKNGVNGQEFKLIANYAPVNFTNSVFGRLTQLATEENPSLYLQKLIDKRNNAAKKKQSKTANTVTIYCDGGCGLSVTLRKNKLRKADYYLCQCGYNRRSCENKLPKLRDGMVRHVDINAAGSFCGYSDRWPDIETAMAVKRAKELRDYGLNQ